MISAIFSQKMDRFAKNQEFSLDSKEVFSQNFLFFPSITLLEKEKQTPSCKYMTHVCFVS